jgi:hypothetical protein
MRCIAFRMEQNLHLSYSVPATGGGSAVSSRMGLNQFLVKGPVMRPHVIVGFVLILLGVLALAVRSVTYFTTERIAGPLGFFAWDVERPHTVFISPVAGLIALAIGIALVLMARWPTRA